MQFVFEDILLNKIIRNHLLSGNMHHLIMLPLLSHAKDHGTLRDIFGARQPRAKKKLSNSWQWAKPFTPCAARTIIFQRKNLNYLIVCFTQCTLFLPKFVFSCIADLFALRCLWVVCDEDKCCVVTQRAGDIRVARLVYVRTYCVPIATVNQNKRTRLLDLGEAQIKSIC